MTTPVVAIFVAKEGHESQLEALFRTVIETTLKEAGCINYQLNRDVSNPRKFVWTEEWESQAHLDAHLNAPHIQTLFGQTPEHVETSEIIALTKLGGGAAQ